MGSIAAASRQLNALEQDLLKLFDTSGGDNRDPRPHC